jgi:hypothetical protein
MKRGGGGAISFLIAAIAVLLPFALLAAPAWSETVAMITDLRGKVAVEDDKTRSVSILAEIEAGMRVRLESGARLVTLYVKSGDEYAFAGPSQVEFHANGPRVLSGAMSQKRASPFGSKVSIKPGSVRQAAFVMRSNPASGHIRLLTLSGTKTLETHPEFRWQPLDGAKSYRFELMDGSGRVVAEQNLNGVSYRLPSTVFMDAGATYTWQVSVRLADGRRYAGTGDFSLVSAALRREAEDLRPASNAPVSDRVAFAAWLDQMELRDEARKYWKALAMERPADARLKALAAE